VPLPHAVEEAPHPPVVEARGEPRAGAGLSGRVIAARSGRVITARSGRVIAARSGRVIAARSGRVRAARWQPVARQHRQGFRPDAAVAELEIGVAGVAGDGPPPAGITHTVDQRAVAAGGLAEAAPVIALAPGVELAVDERDQLPGQVVRV